MAPVLSESVQVAVDPRTFTSEMLDYIRLHFSEMLGKDAALLDAPGGLDELASKLHAMARVIGQRPIR